MTGSDGEAEEANKGERTHMRFVDPKPDGWKKHVFLSKNGLKLTRLFDTFYADQASTASIKIMQWDRRGLS